MSNAERALRSLQQYDELAGRGGSVLPRDGRRYLIGALDALGDELRLECTGVAEGDGFYSHNGDTCPIHEWLVDDDYEEVSGDNDD